MSSATTVLPDLELARLRALVAADIGTAAPLHSEDYQLITPNGSDMTKADYLGAIGSGQLRYRVFETASDIAVLGDGPIAVLRYQARISFDALDGFGSALGHVRACEGIKWHIRPSGPDVT